jgi:phenylpyruvate tautomerase PptA (4-oxalocrotonate tautomerase family)
MPIARIDITGPKSAEYKRALIYAVRGAIVSCLGATDERVNVRVVETEPDCVDVPTCRTERYTVVDIMMYEGRTDEMELAFAETLRAKLASDPGIEPSEIAIALHSMSKIDLNVLPGEALG